MSARIEAVGREYREARQDERQRRNQIEEERERNEQERRQQQEETRERIENPDADEPQGGESGE